MLITLSAFPAVESRRFELNVTVGVPHASLLARPEGLLPDVTVVRDVFYRVLSGTREEPQIVRLRKLLQNKPGAAFCIRKYYETESTTSCLCHRTRS